MSNPKTFTAIDFETMTAERSSACAIGLVKVVNGQIVQKYYSLINPIPDERETDNSAVHGITREMVASAPKFKDIWPTIIKITAGSILVSHNAEFDSAVWNEQLAYYRCTQNPSQFQFLCTYEMTGLSLKDACAKHNIEIGHHHDALDDALACAKVLLAESGYIQADTFKGGVRKAMKEMSAQKEDARMSMDEYYDKEKKKQEWREMFAGVDVEYLGGYPKWPTPGKVNLSIYEAQIILQRGSEKFKISKDMIVAISNEKSSERSVGKAAAGAIVGGVLTGGIGLIVGGALGARKKDTSEIYITYKYNDSELTLNLKPGKNTAKVYSWIYGVFA